MHFQHKPVDIGYKDLIVENGPNGRKYATPSGNKYPSITTVLGYLSKDSINAWKQRVGEEESNRVSRRASTRGTIIHSVLENYINNKEDIFGKHAKNHVVRANFNSIQKEIDGSLTDVVAQEIPLYSDMIGIAGRVDLIGTWDGDLSVVDFKSSAKLKEEHHIQGYFMQCAFYAAAFYERTGIPIKKIVILIAVDNEDPQIFIRNPLPYLKDLLVVKKEFDRRQMFGH